MNINLWSLGKVWARDNRVLVVTVILLWALGTLRILPGLSDGVWQDEAATLLLYANREFTYPFTVYPQPNNHMLFSGVLSWTWERGDTPAQIRMLPLWTWFATLIAITITGIRILGPRAGLIGLAVFCGSSVTEAFALELRGYAFSWPWILLMAATVLPFLNGSNRLAGLGYGVGAIGCTAIMPTNVLAGGVCLSWAVFNRIIGRDSIPAGWRARFAVALVLSIAGLGIYLAVLDDVRMHAAAGWSSWANGRIFIHWFKSTLGEFVWLTPLMAAGLLASLWRLFRRPTHFQADAGTLLFIALFTVIAATLALSPVALFPRTFVPLLPLWCLTVGGLISSGLDLLFNRWAFERLKFAAGGAIGVFALGHFTPPCSGDARNGSADLCRQFYHQEYFPARALAQLDELFGGSNLPLMLDTEAAWALGFAYWNRPGAALQIFEHRNWVSSVGGKVRPRFVVSRTREQVIDLLQSIGFETPRGIDVLAETGYFNVDRIDWANAGGQLPSGKADVP
ncbi:MAG: hypothetical protein O7H40_17020 [Gammaproteobacteria bacterium]|nr:hypothetical protein [Gammaproteobacteria bacterium]